MTPNYMDELEITHKYLTYCFSIKYSKSLIDRIPVLIYDNTIIPNRKNTYSLISGSEQPPLAHLAVEFLICILSGSLY